MHLDFAGGLERAVCFQYITVLVYAADVVGSHKALTYTCGCAKEFVVVNLNRDVTVVCSNHASVVDSLTDFADLFFDFVLVYHIKTSFQKEFN